MNVLSETIHSLCSVDATTAILKLQIQIKCKRYTSILSPLFILLNAKHILLLFNLLYFALDSCVHLFGNSQRN